MTLTVRRNAPIKTAADTATSNRSHGASRRTPVSGLVYATDKRAHMPPVVDHHHANHLQNGMFSEKVEMT